MVRIREFGSSLPKCDGSTTLVVIDPGTPKWPPEKENNEELSCLEELGVLFGGPEASPVAQESSMDQQFDQHIWNFAFRQKLFKISGQDSRFDKISFTTVLFCVVRFLFWHSGS